MTSSEQGVFEHLYSNVPTTWKVLPLPDVLDFQEGPGILAKDFHEEGVPLLRLSCIAGPRTTFDGCNFLDPDKVDKKWAHFKLLENDILLSTSGSLGRVSEVAAEQEGSICYTGIIRFRPNSEDLRQSFIKYFLQSETFRLQATASASGSVLSHFGPTHLKRMSCAIPPVEYQDFIDSLLAPIDKKIQLNHQTNQILEQIAQAIFKSWFVDFEPVKAKMAVLEAGGTAEQAELAAMSAISAKDEAVLKQLQAAQPDAYAELAQTAALFPSAMEESELGEIPAGWEASNLESCTTELRRGISPKYIEEGGVRVINQKCIRNHTVDFTLARRNDTAKRKIEGREIEVGDVLVNSTGVGTSPYVNIPVAYKI